MNKQVKDQWLSWDDVAENFRFLFDDDIGPANDLLNSGTNVIYRRHPYDGYQGWGVIQIDGTPVTGKMMAQSTAEFVFPNMTLPYLRRTHNMMVHRRAGLIDWINTTMEFPFLGIRTTKILYFATDSVTDYTLLKMKCDEYHPSM